MVLDSTLLSARLRAGDAGAYEQVIRQFGAPLLALARRFVASDSDAGSVLQIAFRAASAMPLTIQTDEQVSNWLRRIVIRAAVDTLRQTIDDADAIDRLLPTFDERGRPMGPSRQAIAIRHRLESRDVRAVTRECIAELPGEHRAMLVVCDVEMMSVREAAELVGLSIEAAKMRLHQARLALGTLIRRRFTTAESRLRFAAQSSNADEQRLGSRRQRVARDLSPAMV